MILKRRGTKKYADEMGYVVDIGFNAFLPLEKAGINLDSKPERLALVGQVCEFEIMRLDEERFQIDVSRIVS